MLYEWSSGWRLGKGLPMHYILLHTNNSKSFSGSLSGSNRQAIGTGVYTLCGCSAHLLSMSPAKSTLLEKVVHHVFIPCFNGHVQTCVTIVVDGKLFLTKCWNKVLYHFQVARESSKVKGIATILSMQDAFVISVHCNTNKTHTSG